MALIYVVGALIVVVFIGRIIWKARATMRHLARARGSYRRSDIPTVSDDELFALAVGAINGEQLTANIDSLDTGVDTSRLRQTLMDAWAVHDTETARSVIAWLLSEGHRVHFDEVIRIYKNGGVSDDAKIQEWVRNLEGALPIVRASGLVDSDEPRHGILAWDMGRAVNVARMAFDTRYLTWEEAWKAVHDAAAHTRSAFSSWRELAASYLVGRAMWGGSGVVLDGLIVVTQGLLNDSESPWQYVEFHPTETTQVMKR